jgi:hypothetical protein
MAFCFIMWEKLNQYTRKKLCPLLKITNDGKHNSTLLEKIFLFLWRYSGPSLYGALLLRESLFHAVNCNNLRESFVTRFYLTQPVTSVPYEIKMKVHYVVLDIICVHIFSLKADRLYLRDSHSCKTNPRGTDTPRELRDRCNYIPSVLQMYISFMYNVWYKSYHKWKYINYWDII